MRRKQNILYLAPGVPYPPDKGERIRTFHHLDHLAQESNVYCACFAATPGEAARSRTLRQWCADVAVVPWRRRRATMRAAWGILGGRPVSISAYHDRAMQRRIAQWSAQIRFDAVVAFSTAMAPYALDVPAGRRILDYCDADSAKWQSYGRQAGWVKSAFWLGEARRLRRYERRFLSRFDAALVVTDQERRHLDVNGECRNLLVIPNGVDLPPAPAESAASRPSVIGFLGTLDYPPSVQGLKWFVQYVWPRVLAEVPDAQFRIAGRNPNRTVRRLGRAKGVTLVGPVDSPRIELAKLRTFVAPLPICPGLPNKVLEAMAMARPVVATSIAGATLAARDGEHIIIADEADAFAGRIIDLCRFDEYCDRMASAAYRCAASHYSWAETLDRMASVVLGQLPVPVGVSSETAPEVSSELGSLGSEKGRRVRFQNRIGTGIAGTYRDDSGVESTDAATNPLVGA